MKPRLTDRILGGLATACAKAESELSADDEASAVKALKEVNRAWAWVTKMQEHRSRVGGSKV